MVLIVYACIGVQLFAFGNAADTYRVPCSPDGWNATSGISGSTGATVLVMKGQFPVTGRVVGQSFVTHITSLPRGHISAGNATMAGINATATPFTAPPQPSGYQYPECVEDPTALRPLEGNFEWFPEAMVTLFIMLRSVALVSAVGLL